MINNVIYHKVDSVIHLPTIISSSSVTFLKQDLNEVMQWSSRVEDKFQAVQR